MRPIDAEKLLADIKGLKKSPWFNADYISDERRLGMKEALDMMSSIIRNSPTMDAIPVIRCKDCKKNPTVSFVGCPLAAISRTDDDFCSKAERREE